MSRTNDFKIGGEQRKSDQVSTYLGLVLQLKSEYIKKQIETMSSMVDKIGGLRIRVSDPEMEDIL